MFTSDLHPRVAAGGPGGGQFAPKGGSSSSGSTAAKKPPAKKAPAKKTPQPNGLGYSAKQWANLQKLEAAAKSGKKLDAHQLHELHVAHQKHLAAIGQAPKPAKAAPKPKTAKKTTAKAKKPAKPKAAPKPTTPAQIKANAAAFRL